MRYRLIQLFPRPSEKYNDLQAIAIYNRVYQQLGVMEIQLRIDHYLTEFYKVVARPRYNY
jgi:hypothetical protein